MPTSNSPYDPPHPHLQEAQLYWQIRQLMRHMMEVMLVVEGMEGWARRLAERRREQGLPLPSVELVADTSGSNTGLLVRRVMGVSKEIGRLVVSFL